MLCENEYCIYQKNKKCTLDTISIDEFGRCAECIIPNIPHRLLEKIKNKTLEILEKKIRKDKKLAYFPDIAISSGIKEHFKLIYIEKERLMRYNIIVT